MNNPFEQMREHGDNSQTTESSTPISSPDAITAKDVFGKTDRFDKMDQGAQEPTIYELEKLSKFKYQGQELTPKDLEAMILRQKDYTQKTQSLSKERDSFTQEQKYYENLYTDLQNVKNNPHLVSEFIKVYPEKFHSYVKQVLDQNNNQTQPQQSQDQGQKPQYDVEMMSRMQKLETFYHEQEVAKNTQEINSTVESMSKKYPDAIAEMAIGRVYEASNRGEKITQETWENAFKTVDAQMKDFVKAKYGDLVKKQTEANKKSKDVDSSGGTIGRAPQKFKSLGEVTRHAINDLTNKG